MVLLRAVPVTVFYLILF